MISTYNNKIWHNIKLKAPLLFLILSYNTVVYPLELENADNTKQKSSNFNYTKSISDTNDVSYVGKIGPYRVSVPKNYILGPSFVFDGVDIWKKNSYQGSQVKRSIDDKLSYFSIRIRLSDLKPIESEYDKLRFDNFMSTLPENRKDENEWIFVTYRKTNEVNLYYKFRNIAESEYKGLFINSGTEFGLTKFSSPGHPLGSKNPEDANEAWFQTQNKNTLIYCANYRRNFPPFREASSCHHDFKMDQDVVVEVGMIDKSTDYIKNWFDTEKRLTALFMSFVVK